MNLAHLQSRRLRLISVAILCLLANVVGLAFIFNIMGVSFGAFDWQKFYDPVANNLLEGKGYTLNGGPALRYPPGYPTWLAGVYTVSDVFEIDRFLSIIIFNVLLSIFSCLLLSSIASDIFGSRVGILAGAGMATYPFYIYLAKQPNSEPLFIPLILLGIFWALKGKTVNETEVNKTVFYALLSGVSFGLSALVRPAAIFIGFFVGILILLFLSSSHLKKRILSAFLITVFFTLTIIPWVIYIFLKTDRFIPLSTGGPPTINDGLHFSLIPRAKEHQAKLADDIRVFMKKHANLQQEGKLSRTSDIVSFILSEFKGNPKTVIKLYFIKALRAWYGTHEMWYEKAILFVQIPYLLLGGFGFILVMKKSDIRSYGYFFIGLIGYFWLSTILSLSILRYMMPAMPLVIAFGAYGCVRLWDTLCVSQKSLPSDRTH